MFSTTTQLPGGKLSTRISSEQLNFQTASGGWRAVDTSLKATGDGFVRAAAVDGEVRVPSSLGRAVELEHDGRPVSFRLVGAGSSRSVDGAEAEFSRALPGVDVSYVTTPRGVKETLVLSSAKAPQVFSYDVRGGSAWSAAVEAGVVVLRDGGGSVRYRMAAPLAWDSAKDPSFTNALALSVAKVSAGRWTVTLRPDAAWLSDAARVFPVSIDPDFSWADGTTKFHGATDCYLSGNAQANYTFCAQTYLQTGFYNRPYKSIFKFDIASAHDHQ